MALAVAGVTAAVTLAACSSSSSPTSTSAPASSATVTIRNFAFIPATLTVSPGAVVKVVNEDQVTHTLTANGQFDTGDIPAGQSKTFTAPNAKGSYSYICSIHTFMKGTLVVS
jgi:plastocyanin